MNLVWGILGIIVILYIRVWIINNAFKNKKFKRSISLNIFVLSLILVAFLYFYKDILIYLKLENLYLLENGSPKSIGSFVIYCLSFIVLLTTSFGNINKNKSIKFISIALLLFLGIGLGGAIVGINVLVMYYLISSYAEEILKFSIGQNMYLERYDTNLSKQTASKMNYKSQNNINNNIHYKDLIFFAIIAGLGFSVIENIFYIVVPYINHLLGLQTGGEGKIMLSIGRSIFTTLLHIVATGLIAFFVTQKTNKKITNLMKILVGILSGFLLHGLYNLSLFYEIKIVTILILVVCYFILSFLLFKSDLIYQKK